ncbi:MAG TPA: hypothetical protein VL359_03100, partial [bacterium]|nr:hypothetical protein [bacterium]
MLSARFKRLLDYAFVGRALVLPALVLVLLAGLLLGLWAMERKRADAALQALTRQAADLYAMRLEAQLSAQTEALQVLSVQWSSAARADKTMFQGLAEPFLAQVPSLRGLVWADRNLHVRWVVPSNHGALAAALESAATPGNLALLREDAASMSLTALRLESQVPGSSALVVLRPAALSIGSSGYVGAVLPAPEEHLLTEPLSQDFAVTLTPVATAGPDAAGHAASDASAHATVSLANLRWDLRLEPRRGLAERTLPAHNVLLLVAGLGLSLALAWMSRRLLLRSMASQ